MKRLILCLCLMITVVFTGCDWGTQKEENVAAVSIPPLNGLLKDIAGDKLETITLIPAGYSPTNYEPSPKSIEKLSNSKVFFTAGVPAEVGIKKSARDFNKDLEIINLSDKPGEMFGERHFEDEESENHEEEHKDEHNDGEEHEEGHEGHNHSGLDPHQWISPKRAKVMAKEITDTLVKIDSANKETYLENYETIAKKIDGLDEAINELVQRKTNKSFLIYHPSLGYLADDYGLDMISIESSGKEATAKSMTKIIDMCKEKGIKLVLYQAEMDSRQAEIIADEIGGEVYKINPLEEDYSNNIEGIIKALDSALK